MVTTHTHAKIQVQRTIGSKNEWKQTNGQTRPIALPFPLKRGQ